MMTVVAIIAGLAPIMWSSGTGSEVMKRIATPMVGGMVSATILTLVVVPAIYGLWKGIGLPKNSTGVILIEKGENYEKNNNDVSVLYYLSGRQRHGCGAAKNGVEWIIARWTMAQVRKGGTFKHEVMVDGIHAEFQIMELASMKMSDPEGHTHHVMVSFMKDGKQLAETAGKVKAYRPSEKNRLPTLKDFGSGVFAANFTIDEQGRWGVICLFKDMDGKHTVKFWYEHGM